MELYLMYNAVRRLLDKAGLNVARSLVGNYVTCLDMAGCSLTTILLDDELDRLWRAPVQTAALRWGV
jgi:dihydroxyacetone kinase-like protein